MQNFLELLVQRTKERFGKGVGSGNLKNSPVNS